MLAKYVVAVIVALSAPTTAMNSRSQFHDAMRLLWGQHVEWTRMFIVSAAAGAPDKDAVTQRLLQNQADIGNAVAEYYGRAAGDKLTDLLKSHILIAADLVGAAKGGDNAKVTELNAKWRGNAEDIARFLHGANPKHWPEATLRSLLFTHLDQTLQEATHRLQGDFAADIKDYDAIEKHAMMMADALSDGIMKQFPSKFTGAKKIASR